MPLPMTPAPSTATRRIGLVMAADITGMLAAVEASLWRRALLPPRARAGWTPERVRLIAWARIAAAGLALLGNISVFALLGGADGVRSEAVWTGVTVNVTLLALDIALTVALLRRMRPGWLVVFRTCLILEVAAGLLWLQLTGTVSSYYIGAGLLITLLYRLACDYQTGLFVGAATLLGHFGLFFLEEAGVLQPASLFVEAPSGLYGSETFRWAAMWSM